VNLEANLVLPKQLLPWLTILLDWSIECFVCGQNYVEQFPNPQGWWADWIVEEGAPSCMIQIPRSGRCVLPNEIRLAGAEEVRSISRRFNEEIEFNENEIEFILEIYPAFSRTLEKSSLRVCSKI
jgi:hypothetical protein